MREIKFRYRVKDLNDGHVIVLYKTLKEIEAGLVILNNKTYTNNETNKIQSVEWTQNVLR